MAAALGVLGINTYHSLLWLSTNLGDVPMWLEAIDAKFFSDDNDNNTSDNSENNSPRGASKQTPLIGREEWDQLLHNFGGVSADTPAIAFSEDLIAAYPEAKVVLTNREIEDWFQSYDNGVIAASTSWFNNFMADLVPSFIGATREPHRRVLKGWLGMDWNAESMRAKARPGFVRHYENVRRIVPKERLLEFRLSEGWEPLCEFLGKPVPDVPFPHLNDRKELERTIWKLMMKGLRYAGLQILLYGGPVVVALFAYLALYGKR